MTEPQYNNMFSRLIGDFSIVAHKGGEYLDLVNFNREQYREVIDPKNVEEIFKPTHGYACPDGSFELCQLIKNLEWKRELVFRKWLKREHIDIADNVLSSGVSYDDLSVGIGVGTTGVMNCLIRSIVDSKAPCIPEKANVILCIPNYPVYDAIVTANNAESRHMVCNADNGFLPDEQLLAELADENTVAFVVTFPNNPAQTTFRPRQYLSLQNMIHYCQEREIYFIADNIYQDTIWTENQLNAEIFSLIHDPRYVVKVFGPSKDRPFYSGRRLGYYIGDKSLENAYFYYASISSNTHNSHSSCMFALDLLFRRKLIEQESPDIEDCMALDTFLAGWNIRIDPAYILDEIRSRNMYEIYCQNIDHNNQEMATTLHSVSKFASVLPVVKNIVNENIGNVLFCHVNQDIFSGTCREFFAESLKRANLGVLAGNVFGMPEIQGQAWFRITSIHDRADVINKRMKLLSDAFAEV